MCTFSVEYGFLLILHFYLVQSEDTEDDPTSLKFRNIRNCKHRPYSSLEPFYRKSIFENTSYLVFVILLGILFGLMFLGCVKGLLGICGGNKISEYGMNMLVDLPKPLDAYRESELKGRPVCYDVIGWPVHPDTGERTVKILPMKEEFCLNIIFFLAYPIAIILKLCSVCCCIRDFRGEDDRCFREINVIKCKNNKKNSSGPEVDMYKENDIREARDTNYVVNYMRQSQNSLEGLHRYDSMK